MFNGNAHTYGSHTLTHIPSHNRAHPHSHTHHHKHNTHTHTHTTHSPQITVPVALTQLNSEFISQFQLSDATNVHFQGMYAPHSTQHTAHIPHIHYTLHNTHHTTYFTPYVHSAHHTTHHHAPHTRLHTLTHSLMQEAKEKPSRAGFSLRTVGVLK